MGLPSGEISQLLVKPRNGHHEPKSALVPLVYDEMRHVPVDHARARLAKQCGGSPPKIPPEVAADFPPAQSEQCLTLNEALERLSQPSRRQGRKVEKSSFGAFNDEQAAAVLAISTRIWMRDGSVARA